MSQILDQPAVSLGTERKYGGFWVRVGASLIDFLILAPLTFGITYFNVTSWKSIMILILTNIVAIGYKPVMEFLYGATFGKKSLNLRVVNLEFEQADLNSILSRNIFHVVGAILSLFFSVILFMEPGFEEITGYMEYSQFAAEFTSAQYLQWGLAVITLIDTIVLLTDDRKRAWHDRIGKTFVIQE